MDAAFMGQPNPSLGNVPATDKKEQLSDAQILNSPASSSLGLFQSERIIRALIMCTNRTERHVVALCDYHGYTANEAGEILNIGGARVAEVWEAVHLRERSAAAQDVADARRRAMDDGKQKPAKKRSNKS